MNANQKACADVTQQNLVKTPKELARDLFISGVGATAHWFVPLVGLIYACGFLIVFTFFNSFGINGADFFQAKYIHVGSLFVMACIVCLLPMAWVIVSFHLSRDPEANKSMFGLSTCVFGLMLLIFFVAVAFAPRGFFETKPVLLSLSCIFPLAFIIIDYVAVVFDDKYKPRVLRFTVLMKQTLTVAELALFVFIIIFVDQKKSLGTLVWNGGPKGAIYFVVFMGLIVCYVELMIMRYKKFAANVVRRLNILVSTCCVVGVFLYLAMLTFAYGLYPYVPCAKGGGDYSDACPIRFNFKSELSNAIPSEVCAASSNNSLILLDNNSSSFFVASIKDAGGPTNWQAAVTNRPPVYEIRRDLITSISYLTNK